MEDHIRREAFLIWNDTIAAQHMSKRKLWLQSQLSPPNKKKTTNSVKERLVMFDGRKASQLKQCLINLLGRSNDRIYSSDKNDKTGFGSNELRSALLAFFSFLKFTLLHSRTIYSVELSSLFRKIKAAQKLSWTLLSPLPKISKYE